MKASDSSESRPSMSSKVEVDVESDSSKSVFDGPTTAEIFRLSRMAVTTVVQESLVARSRSLSFLESPLHIRGIFILANSSNKIINYHKKL